MRNYISKTCYIHINGKNGQNVRNRPPGCEITTKNWQKLLLFLESAPKKIGNLDTELNFFEFSPLFVDDTPSFLAKS